MVCVRGHIGQGCNSCKGFTSFEKEFEVYDVFQLLCLLYVSDCFSTCTT